MIEMENGQNVCAGLNIEQGPLAGTVNYHNRHVVVCTGDTAWPSNLAEMDGFVSALLQEVGRQDAGEAVKVTACDWPRHGEGYDLLVFPQRMMYHNVTAADLPQFVDDVLIHGRVCEPITHSPLGGQYVFVCVHGARDERCGACGPVIASAFEREVAARGLAETVTVIRSSHITGHKFAGVAILMPEGDYYGRVTPLNVPELVEQAVVRGEIVADLWRGRMGLTPEAQKQWVGTRQADA